MPAAPADTAAEWRLALFRVWRAGHAHGPALAQAETRAFVASMDFVPPDWVDQTAWEAGREPLFELVSRRTGEISPELFHVGDGWFVAWADATASLVGLTFALQELTDRVLSMYVFEDGTTLPKGSVKLHYGIGHNLERAELERAEQERLARA